MSRNPFDDDFNSSGINKTNHVKSYTMAPNSIEDEADYYEKQIEKYMQESLDSTERSRRHLDNSEKLGVQTAQDLLEQREKLERTEANLQDIRHTTQITQRNLNSLKSFFGGFLKNKFSRKPQEQVPSATVPPSKSASHLNDKLTELTQGGPSSASFSGGSSLSDSSRDTLKGTRWEEMDKQIDSNLDSMAATLRNIRGLGLALGQEVQDQNEMLDRIHNTALGNDEIIRSQDKQMKKLLNNVDSKQDDSSAVPSMDTSTKMSLAMKAGSFLR
ncbi:unnamed protein product [Auanema sp. JU1783]|nr:unnamed protein product [Auanema sp. JU1783]